ncbi:MAG: hypothetical protein KGI28_04330 [Thaumarchaeota archaeon]|nr:hypothetical protein [Nitrososphaerota archaeon]
MAGKKNLVFRAWFYFRQGWSTYFAFILAAINTMVTTYYLAIKDVPALKVIFPSFLAYVSILSFIGIPTLVAVGYLHFKRSGAFRAEADISIEVNPYTRRMLENTEILLSLYPKLSEILVKISKNEKLSEKEVEEISNLQNEIKDHMKNQLMKEKNKSSFR